MKFQIVIAQKEDLQKILDLQKESYMSEAELYKDFNIHPLTQPIESINEEFDKGWLFLMIVDNNDIIATGRGITKEGTTYIAKLAVKTEF